MVKYRLHENGWVVILEDVNFKTITQEDVNHIARLVAHHTCVVAYDQDLSVEDELRVLNMFKNPEPLVTPSDENYKHYWVKGTDGLIQRVTADVDEEGVEGIAAHVDEMVWHCNDPQKKKKSPIVWLYGVKGTVGSRTSWNNNVLSYNDLDPETKELVNGLKFVPLTELEFEDNLRDGTGWSDETYTPDVVQTNIAGKTGMLFPFYQISHFVGMTPEESKPIIDRLREFTTQDKYCYHHDWVNGSLVISEQNLGLHKRWPFEKIKERLLHRAMFDFPDQDYLKDPDA